jgi:signal transduction histidine kinase
MVLVSGVAFALAGWLSTRVVLVELDQPHLVPASDIDVKRFAEPVAQFLLQNGKWDGVAPAVQRASTESGRRVLLLGADNKAVALAPDILANTRVEVAPGHQLSLELHDAHGIQQLHFMNPPHIELRNPEGAPAGTLYFLPLPKTNETALASRASSSMVRRLITILLATLLLALAATFLLSRRILRPLESLKTAVHRIEQGELAQRVKITSKDEIGELARAFNSMATSLARAEQLRRDMVNDVAHELRTPLTNIRCQLEEIQDGLTLPTPQVVASLHEEVIHLSRLADDLRDLALADAGHLSLEPVATSLHDAVELVVGKLRPRFSAQAISLQADVPADLPPVLADPLRLNQVLRNLLDNALAHTPPGGTIAIDAEKNGEQEIRLSVRDSGPGIAAEHLAKVFDRFYRTDHSRSRHTGGAGLGLAIVQQLVAAHGGRVGVESEPGNGALFWVILPVDRITPQPKE